MLLEGLAIPRQVTTLNDGEENFEVLKFEIHHFCDSSQTGYGCVSYLRSVSKNGNVSVSLLYSKARVTPIKPMTIPRLELCAAVLAAKVGTTLRRELDLVLSHSVFWCDSEIVLAYIGDDSKRYHTFVANRVSMIRSQTAADQWHHVPGNINPADIASRGATPKDLLNSKWFKGPDFLLLASENWPKKHSQVMVLGADPEVKHSPKETCAMANVTKGDSNVSIFDNLLNKMSCFKKLIRIVAYVLLFRNKCLNKGEGTNGVSCALLEKAKRLICKYEQKRLNLKDFTSLSPYVDDEGLIRVGGRLGKLQDSGSSQVNQVLIPKGHLCNLIIRDTPVSMRHMGTEYVLAELRAQGYWIRRNFVKSEINKCVTCKRFSSKPMVQKMADLPLSRVVPSPPFTHTGVDCFGPFLVKRGRSDIKRWDCIFTCFSTRAVHIEKLDDMSTESFINALNRFICRRGRPETIR